MMPRAGEIGNLLPNNRRQRRTCYALCHILYPVSAAHTSIFRMDSNSTSYHEQELDAWATSTAGIAPPQGPTLPLSMPSSIPPPSGRSVSFIVSNFCTGHLKRHGGGLVFKAHRLWYHSGARTF